ncbi:hypothetical protein ILUMI_07595 [Ignelater luminosus]|uniref:Protein white n=1 Tax=Ignelater luminosus TaxID=2038154 RepID=A0A8K0D7Z6_IGNLU|nr:hypothetical protein ILUMI_07595 [Ignelater luminosus]
MREDCKADMVTTENSEKEPLIKLKGFRRSYSTTSVDEGTSIYTSENNGYHGGHSILLDSERITFAWSEINVFTLGKSKTKMSLLFKDRNGQVPSQGKQILKNVSGIAYPGEILAILGSSGAGKTTLLNTLTSRSSSRLLVTGMRCANGVHVNLNSLTSQMAYVQQEDLYVGTLTVKEHLIFQALVRMDKHIPYKQRIKRVEEVMSELGLNECENTLIGIRGRLKGISGGEMKRLSFASEVLTNPPLMFCDEPTSGLDSFMALNVVQVLKRLALTGKTIICTIHQPSSEVFAMFDKVLLMAEGRVAFLGTREEASGFFTSLDAPCPLNYNPADYFIQLLAILPGREESCKQAVNMICDKFERSELGVKLAVEAATMTKTEFTYSDYFFHDGNHHNNRYKASWFSQFRAVLWRSWISIIKEPLLIKVRLLQTIITALIIGAIYFGQTLNQDGVMNINGVLFLSLTNMTFQNVFAVVNVFCGELPLLLREHKNGMYRTDVYFLSKAIAETPLFILIPVVYVAIFYYLIGLNPEQPRLFINMGILVLVANVAVGFGYFVSCMSSSVSMALSLAPPLTIPFLLFGGFFLNVRSIPIYFKWISYVSWFEYGNEALMVNQWKGIESINCTASVTSICPKDGQIVLEMFNFSESSVAINVLALFGLACGFRLLAYISLVIKTYTFD